MALSSSATPGTLVVASRGRSSRRRTRNGSSKWATVLLCLLGAAALTAVVALAYSADARLQGAHAARLDDEFDDEFGDDDDEDAADAPAARAGKAGGDDDGGDDDNDDDDGGSDFEDDDDDEDEDAAAAHYADDDELMEPGARTADAAAKAAAEAAAKERAAAAAAAAASAEPKSYTYEYIAIAVFVLYGAVYFVGRSANEKIARAWEAEFCEKLFATQFARIGLTADGASNSYLEKESQSSYRFYASGRLNCIGLLATLELKKRHDLFSLLMDLATPTKDHVIIEVPVDDAAMKHPFVFAVVASRVRRTFHQESVDLSNYCAVVPRGAMPARVPDDLDVLTESHTKELVDKLLPPKVCKALAQFRPLFYALHFTDASPAPEGGGGTSRLSRKALRFKFVLPSGGVPMGALQAFMEMVLFYVDLVPTIRLSAKAQQKAAAMRERAQAEAERKRIEERTEALRDRKAEAEREKAAKYDAMTREQKERFDAKEAKRKAKENKGARMRMKMTMAR